MFLQQLNLEKRLTVFECNMQSEYTILLSTTTDLTVNGKAFVKNTTFQKIAC